MRCQNGISKAWQNNSVNEILSNLSSADVVVELLDSSRAGLILPVEKNNEDEDTMNGAYLGPQFTDIDVVRLCRKYQATNIHFGNFDELTSRVADILEKGQIVGWMQGRMEYGPRALGSRSILAKAYPREMKDKVNKIKRREKFRPFAGSVLQDKVHTLFNVPKNKYSSPYMNFCFTVRIHICKYSPVFTEYIMNITNKIYVIPVDLVMVTVPSLI